jgi:membrane protease YdiL (CAAX protease family)
LRIKITKLPVLFCTFIIIIATFSSLFSLFLVLNGKQVEGDWINYQSYVDNLLLYASVALIVWFEEEHLERFHLERVTLILVVVFGILTSRLDILYEAYLKIILLILSIIILAGVIKNWRKIPKTKGGWVGISLFTASIFLVPFAFIEAFFPALYSNIYIQQGDLGIYLIRRILYNLSFVSLFEELIFRGLLWEYLRRSGMRENLVFWVQATIFWLLHIWRIGNPFYFFITLPIVTLMNSLLTRYSKQVAPSIFAHTITNVGVPVIVYYFFL